MNWDEYQRAVQEQERAWAAAGNNSGAANAAVAKIQELQAAWAAQQAPPPAPPAPSSPSSPSPSTQQAQAAADAAYNSFQNAVSAFNAINSSPMAANLTGLLEAARQNLIAAEIASNAANDTLRKAQQTPAAPAAPAPAPAPANFTPPAPAPQPVQRQEVVKSPNRDVFNFSQTDYSLGTIQRVLFEQVGGIEIISLARRETIEGQNPYYSLISNLSSIKKNFDPTSIISGQKNNDNIVYNYAIDLNSKIPSDEYLNTYNLDSFYYIDTNGDFVIELDNLEENEVIELEIAQGGTIKRIETI